MKKINIFFIIMLLTLIAFSINVFAVQSASKTAKISLINQDPDYAIPGDVVEVRLGIENTGDQAMDDFILEIIPSYPFYELKGEDLKEEIGRLNSHQEGSDMYISKFIVGIENNVNAGSYDLKYRYYEEGTDISTQKSVSIDIKSKDGTGSIEINKNKILPGEETELTFTINNQGSTSLKNIYFSWDSEDSVLLPVESDNTKFISYISPGESKDLVFKVIADSNANAGLYDLDLTIEYDDSLTGSEIEKTTTAGIYIGGQTDFDIGFSDQDGNEMTFTIANIGSNPAYSVAVKIPSQKGYIISGSNFEIIGNLNNGDYTVVGYTLTPNSNEALIMEIDYTDTQGVRRTVQKEVNIGAISSKNSTKIPSDFSSRKTGERSSMPGPMGRMSGNVDTSSKTKNIFLIIGSCVIIIVGIIFYSKYKKRKLRKNK